MLRTTRDKLNLLVLCMEEVSMRANRLQLTPSRPVEFLAASQSGASPPPERWSGAIDFE